MIKKSPPGSAQAVVLDLGAVIATVASDEPRVLLVNAKDTDSRPRLPSGPFDPEGDRTMEEGLRRWVAEQTGLAVGFVEQLYTFGDRFRDPDTRAGGPRSISVGYVALIRQSAAKRPAGSDWFDWYRLFPWEDWRNGRPALLDEILKPKIGSWIDGAGDAKAKRARRGRMDVAFGFSDVGWDADRVLERYELLYEAGLVAETVTDGRIRTRQDQSDAHAWTGLPLHQDHRRILATALGRLRGKIRYRPVIFEVMPIAFTLLQLQRAVEALAGAPLHKQNFRRLVAAEGLVEPTGRVSSETGGRPAELFRFRPDVVRERPAPGVRMPRGRRTK
ncbi:MAG: hypothetical protein GKS03_04060 [Alphaproteobacteria bacterium]|nr:hypothetical protein [Alphaproteobacteria bacterium]